MADTSTMFGGICDKFLVSTAFVNLHFTASRWRSGRAPGRHSPAPYGHTRFLLLCFTITRKHGKAWFALVASALRHFGVPWRVPICLLITRCPGTRETLHVVPWPNLILVQLTVSMVIGHLNAKKKSEGWFLRDTFRWFFFERYYLRDGFWGMVSEGWFLTDYFWEKIFVRYLYCITEGWFLRDTFWRFFPERYIHYFFF